MNSYLKQNHLKNNYLAIPDDYIYSPKVEIKKISIKTPVPAITKAINNKQAEIDETTKRINAIKKEYASIGETITEEDLARVNVLEKDIETYREYRKKLNNEMSELNKILLKRQELNKETADNVVSEVVDDIEKQYNKSGKVLTMLRDELTRAEVKFNILLTQAQKGDLSDKDKLILKTNMLTAKKNIDDLHAKFNEEYEKYEKVITKYNYYESSFRTTRKGIQLIEYVRLNGEVVKADILKPVNKIISNVNQGTQKYLTINNDQLSQLMKLKGMTQQVEELAKAQEQTNRQTSQDKEIIKELEEKTKELSDKLDIVKKEAVKVELTATQQLALQALNNLKPDENTARDIISILKDLNTSKVRGATGIYQAFLKMTNDYAPKRFKDKSLLMRTEDMLFEEDGLNAIRDFITTNLARVIGSEQLAPYLEKIGKGRRYKQSKQLTKKQINTIIKKIRRIGGGTGHELEGSSSSDEDF